MLQATRLLVTPAASSIPPVMVENFLANGA
jgi:hypothetical protein